MGSWWDIHMYNFCISFASLIFFIFFLDENHWEIGSDSVMWTALWKQDHVVPREWWSWVIASIVIFTCNCDEFSKCCRWVVVFHEDDLLPEMPLYLLSLIWKSSVVYEAILWVKTCKSVHNVVLGRYFKAFQTIWCRSDYIWSCVASFWTLLTKR